MENLPLSDFQQIIETDIEILFSELSSITADKTGLLITIVVFDFLWIQFRFRETIPCLDSH